MKEKGAVKKQHLFLKDPSAALENILIEHIGLTKKKLV
jgi:hypothetical protein